jgi:hypothetical protein
MNIMVGTLSKKSLPLLLTNIMPTDFPIYKKQLPQVWLEDDKFIIESDSFRYVIADDLKLLFKLCRRFKSDAIAQTYALVGD